MLPRHAIACVATLWIRPAAAPIIAIHTCTYTAMQLCDATLVNTPALFVESRRTSTSVRRRLESPPASSNRVLCHLLKYQLTGMPRTSGQAHDVYAHHMECYFLAALIRDEGSFRSQQPEPSCSQGQRNSRQVAHWPGKQDLRSCYCLRRGRGRGLAPHRGAAKSRPGTQRGSPLTSK